MLRQISQIQNIGKFDNHGTQDLEKFTLIYAENGKGKTTLTDILRSLGQNKAEFINNRKRLGSTQPIKIIMKDNKNQNYIFENDNWKTSYLDIFVFNDYFVAENVYSGIEVSSDNRKNLHNLIIGSQGILLHNQLQKLIESVKACDTKLKETENKITPNLRGNLSVEEFYQLKQKINIENEIKETEQELNTAKAADTIKQKNEFSNISLLPFDIRDIENILEKDLPSLQKNATDLVKTHLKLLGKEGEAWLKDGMQKNNFINENKICPFCTQSLDDIDIIKHYEAYFSKEYKELISEIEIFGKSLKEIHDKQILINFERNVLNIKALADYWKQFIDISLIEIDTIPIFENHQKIFNQILEILRQKYASPLEKRTLADDIKQSINQYNAYCNQITEYSITLQKYNTEIQKIKQQAGNSNIQEIKKKLDTLIICQTRYTPEVIKLCDEYLSAKQTKKSAEEEKNKAKKALEDYQNNIFPQYTQAINKYLKKFGTNFELNPLQKQNQGGVSCTYSIKLDTQYDIPLTNFKNTLSAGDRNTLALAFFFASLEQEPELHNKIIIIDDPMTSLDEHRIRHTHNIIIDFSKKVSQVIVLSHFKPFLCELWKETDKNFKPQTLRIKRHNNSSIIVDWCMDTERQTEHDKRYELVAEYLKNEDPNKTREVAEALRPMLEDCLRIKYPSNFKAGACLNEFSTFCDGALKKGQPILDKTSLDNFNDMRDYSNKYHHSTNSSYKTEDINDTELVDYCNRVIQFIQK